MDMKVTLWVTFLVLVTNSFADDVNSRLDCRIENDFQVNENTCKERDCIWDKTHEPDGVPVCYIDVTKVGYNLNGAVTQKASGIEADLKVKDTSHKLLKSSPQIENLKLSVDFLTEKILRIKLFDAKNKRYEVPIELDMVKHNTKEENENKRKYSVKVTDDSKHGFEISVERKDTKTKVFDTSIGGLVFSDQFLQMATRLPSKNIYGMGENTHQTFRHDLSYKTWGLFARDRPPGKNNLNLYGVHPFYTVIESDGKAFGVLLWNSNAMEYTLLPDPAISLKTIGGILDFFVFVGDNPEEVVQLYTSLIGRTFMPPFWSLGFQLSRYGFKSDSDVKSVIERNQKANIPLDNIYLDIDYMSVFRDFTYDQNKFKNLPQLMRDTNKEGIHWTPIIDAAIEADMKYESFADGYKNDVFIKWSKSIPLNERQNPANVPTEKDVYYGKVFPKGPAVFPDFLKNATKQWWTRQVKQIHSELPISAIWDDMNEPSNFEAKCPHNKYDFPPIYLRSIDNQLSSATACMSLVQGENNELMHYDVHSLWGYSETIATQKAIHEVTGKRGFVVSRSTFVGSGQYGAHWLGDNTAEWAHIGNSIIGMLEFNLFGINFVGADICGFMRSTTPELCRQWSRVGAFYPFSRNHNEINAIDQDPAVWITRGHPEVTDATRSSLRMRYRLLPYLYTLFYHSHTKGDTVARPLVHEWPKDQNTAAIDEQFLWGKHLLISPFIHENQKEVNAYLPPDELWYDLNDGLKLMNKSGKITIPDTHPTGPPPLHLRGGAIIPMVNSDNFTTTSSPVFNSLNLVVLPSKEKTGSGDLFWDDRDSIDTIENGKYNFYEFKLNSDCSLDIDVTKSGYSSHPTVESITIANTQHSSGQISATVDGKAVKAENKNGVTVITVNSSLDKKHRIEWKDNQKCNLF